MSIRVSCPRQSGCLGAYGGVRRERSYRSLDLWILCPTELIVRLDLHLVASQPGLFILRAPILIRTAAIFCKW